MRSSDDHVRLDVMRPGIPLQTAVVEIAIGSYQRPSGLTTALQLFEDIKDALISRGVRGRSRGARPRRRFYGVPGDGDQVTLDVRSSANSRGPGRTVGRKCQRGEFANSLSRRRTPVSDYQVPGK